VRPIRKVQILTCLLLLIAMISPVLGVSGATGIILMFNPSARSAGMGDTGTAVCWGESPNYWANPANLAYHRGLQFERSDYQLAKGLATGISLVVDRVTFAAYGIGVSLSGRPFSPPKGYLLDMGVQEGTNEVGEPTGSQQSWMKAKSLSLGLSLAGLIDHLRQARNGSTGRIGGFGDLAIGYTTKQYTSQLAGDAVLMDLPTRTESESSYDYGILGRFSPFNSIDGIGAGTDLANDLDVVCGGLRVDLSYGMSVLNAREVFVRYPDSDSKDPLPKMHRHGWGVHLTTGFPSLRDQPIGQNIEWLIHALTPLFACGYSRDCMIPGITWDSPQNQYVYDRNDHEEENYSGWEITALGMFHLRRGHFEALAGDIDDDTYGWGVSFRFQEYGGVRYDRAEVPQARGLPKVIREPWSIYCDILALSSR